MTGVRQATMGDATVDRERAAALLRRAIAARDARCAVVGLGFVGATIMRALADAGFDVRGVDRSKVVVDRLRAVDEPPGPERIGSDPALLEGAEIVVVCVRASCEPGSSPDLEPLDSAGRALARWPAPARLVVVASTLPPGTTRSFARRWCAEPSTLVAYAPERLQTDDTTWPIDRIPHLVGGVDETATDVARRFVQTYSHQTFAVPSPEVAELAKLHENVFIAVGIALAGEITKIAHATGVEATDVTAAAGTKPFGYHAYHPGAGIGGHCIPNDLEMLRRSADALGVDTPLLDAASTVAGQLPSLAVDRLDRLLAARGRSLAGSSVLLVGTGFKIGSADQTATPAAALVRELRNRGATPVFADSRNPRFVVDGRPVDVADHRSLGSARVYGAALVVSGDPGVESEAIMQSADLILDLGGGRVLAGGMLEAERL